MAYTFVHIITANDDCSIFLWIYLNNFINNTYNAYSYNSTNIWNSTEKHIQRFDIHKLHGQLLG